ncbi:hypothetical protein F4678DRAFT_458048 [Xylaria arbuscula]|nr:hypothetical protein F4678DRAFT_458048 [Xylaria arbuscula]
MNGLSLAVIFLRAFLSKPVGSVVETKARLTDNEARTDVEFRKSPVRVRGNKALFMAPQRVDNQTRYIVPEEMPGGEFSWELEGQSTTAKQMAAAVNAPRSHHPHARPPELCAAHAG